MLVLERSNHPNVISLVDRMKSKNSYYLILDYCNGGDLASYVASRGRLLETEARDVIYQVIDGMRHLYQIGVVHRDIKLANLLIHFPSQVSSRILSEEIFIVKIADLGFSKIQANIEQDLNTTYCGTPINMAPEILCRDSYSFKSDVWSVGTILYEMLTGSSPFKEAISKEDLKKRHKRDI